MIKSLTPYYVTIPFVSPFSGLTCTSYTLQVFVWNGAKNAPPTLPVYEFTKSNPTSSTNNDFIDISNIVNDFINFSPSADNETILLDGNNQNWVKVQTFYTTTEPLDLETPTNVSVQLMTKGYGYGMEGQNPQLPINKILLSGSEFKVNRSGTFVLPILIAEAGSTITAVNETANIFFQDTLIDVLVNDNLGFTPTNIVSISSSMPSSVGTFTIEANKIKFTKGVGSIITPQTCTYTIQDSTGANDTAVLTVNITAVPILPDAQDETFAVNDSELIDLDVLNNDALGTAPTTIVSVDDSLLTCGTITNNTTDVTFTPNGVYGVSETFTYTIEDSLANQSTATVTLNVSHLIGETETAKRTIGTPVNSGVCTMSDFISFIIETQVAGVISDGDICYNNDLSVFDGFDNYHRVYLDSDPTTTYNLRINSLGIIEIIALC